MSTFYWLLKYICGSRTTVYGGLHGLQNNRSLTRLITERKSEIIGKYRIVDAQVLGRLDYVGDVEYPDEKPAYIKIPQRGIKI